jgi:hypothetical protein
MCLIAKNQKKFKSARFRNSLYTFDKSDPKNLNLPEFIDNLDDNKIYSLIPKIIDKYKQTKSLTLEREELEDISWNSIEVLILIKFYQNNWSFIIPNQKEFFPSFAFTYNINPLQKEVNKIVSLCYDKIERDFSKDYLNKYEIFNALDVTYLLHYFVITHEEYIEED